MSLVKILMALAIIAVILVIVIYYSLSPTVRVVSDDPALKPFVKKYLNLKTNAWIIEAEQGQFIFDDNILCKEGEYTQTPVLRLIPGDEIIIHQFKTHKSNIGSGFTHLYELGEVSKGNRTITFEYDMGTIGSDLNSKSRTTLMTTLWQDATDPKIQWQHDDR